MSIRGFAWAQEVRVGDATLKVLLMTLGGYANTDNQTWHAQDKISFDTEIPVRTLRRKMQQLAEMGLIRIEERRREDGTKTSSLITVLMPEAKLADGHHRPNQGVTIGQNEGLPSANKVAEQGIEKNRKESKPAGAKKKGDIPYSEEFEIEVWQPFPRKTGTSKKKAWDHWRMLTDQQQQQVKETIPAYAAQMKREGRTEEKIKWLAHFISERIYETLSAPGAATPGAGPAKPFWETATPKAWSSALLLWSQNWNWNKIWGPEPGKEGCHVPQYILDRFDLRYRGHLYSVADFEALKARVEAASKHAVDKERAA